MQRSLPSSTIGKKKDSGFLTCLTRCLHRHFPNPANRLTETTGETFHRDWIPRRLIECGTDIAYNETEECFRRTTGYACEPRTFRALPVSGSVFPVKRRRVSTGEPHIFFDRFGNNRIWTECGRSFR